MDNVCLGLHQRGAGARDTHLEGQGAFWPRPDIQTKQVEAYAVWEDGGWLVITVPVR